MMGRRQLGTLAAFTALLLSAAGCPPPAGRSDSPAPGTGASAAANQAADRGMYQPVTYRNAGTPGPAVVVIEGNIKSANATYDQKVTSNNIADYGELELSRAGFKVLERSDLGALKREFQIAYTAGDPAEARKLLGKGKFKATRWVVRFDILKAEPVASAHRGFSGETVGHIAGAFVGGNAGYATDVGVGSIHGSDSAGVWIVGMRYTLIDARTTEQAATGYFEQKMELGSSSRGYLGVESTDEGGLTLDSLTHRLVQDSVAEIDAKYK